MPSLNILLHTYWDTRTPGGCISHSCSLFYVSSWHWFGRGLRITVSKLCLNASWILVWFCRPLSTSCNVVLAFFFMVTGGNDCEGLHQATKKLVLTQQCIAVAFKFIFSVLLDLHVSNICISLRTGIVSCPFVQCSVSSKSAYRNRSITRSVRSAASWVLMILHSFRPSTYLSLSLLPCSPSLWDSAIEYMMGLARDSRWIYLELSLSVS